MPAKSLQLSMPDVLPPQMAGRQYPANGHELSELLARSLVTARSSSIENAKLVIAPLSPLQLCGPVTASAFANLSKRRGLIRKVVVLGPARNALRGIAVPTYRALSTPLGAIPLDRSNLAALRPIVQVTEDNRGFENEGAIETVLPLLQVCLERFELTPVLVGAVYPDVIEDVLSRIWGGPETLIVITSDLSHGMTDDKTRAMDIETRGLIETLAGDQLSTTRADGHRIIAAALLRAAALDLRVTGLDFRTSQNAANRISGHGAFAFEPAMRARLNAPERQYLLRSAAHGVQVAASRLDNVPRPLTTARLPLPLSAVRAAHVSLHRDGVLRGSSGSLKPYRALLTEVVARASAAASADGRLVPVRPEELDALTLTISITSHARTMPSATQDAALAAIMPGRDGIWLEDGPRSAVAMPQVWDQIADPALFLKALRQKAGLATETWSPTLVLRRFTTETFSAPLNTLFAER